MENDYIKILLVDGHKNEASKISACLTQDTDKVFQIPHCNSHTDAAPILQDDALETDVIILDLFILDDVDPQEAYRAINQVTADKTIIVMTGENARSLAHQLMIYGASDIVIRERFEAAPKRLLDAIEYSIIRSKQVQEVKGKYDREVTEHQRVLHSYSERDKIDPLSLNSKV